MSGGGGGGGGGGGVPVNSVCLSHDSSSRVQGSISPAAASLSNRLLPTNSNSTIRGGGETTGGGSLYRHHTGTQQSKGSDVTGGSGVGCNNPHQTLLTEVSQKAERCSVTTPMNHSSAAIREREEKKLPEK
ncbi:hypothetical protein ABVT39_024736 [Epinephelus coioides]